MSVISNSCFGAGNIWYKKLKCGNPSEKITISALHELQSTNLKPQQNDCNLCQKKL